MTPMPEKPPDLTSIARALARANQAILRTNQELVSLVTRLIPEEDDRPAGFVPTPNQQLILDALDGVALRTDAISRKTGLHRSQIFKKPKGGMQELEDEELVGKHPRLGYYRADKPPPELAQLV
jgi:hypothetical protein